MELSVITTFDQGKRPYMEDAYAHHNTPLYFISCIFDGHGGSAVSDFLKQNFTHTFAEQYEKFQGDIKTALLQTCVIMQNFLISTCDTNHGSTANVVVFDKKDRIFFILNLGDSRAVLAQRSKVTETNDHTPETDAALLKGKIKDGRVRGILAVSRSFGDCDLSDDLIFEPDVYIVPMHESSFEFLIHASDGLFDVWSSFNLYKKMESLLKKYSPDESLEKLLETTMRHPHFQDNITITLIIYE